MLGDRLRTDVPASMRSWAMLAEAARRRSGRSSPSCQTVRTGAPGVELAHGIGLFEFLAAHPEHAAPFDAAMSERTAAFAASVAAGHDFSGLRAVVDVGGGRGRCWRPSCGRTVGCGAS